MLYSELQTETPLRVVQIDLLKYETYYPYISILVSLLQKIRYVPFTETKKFILYRGTIAFIF